MITSELFFSFLMLAKVLLVSLVVFYFDIMIISNVIGLQIENRRRRVYSD